MVFYISMPSWSNIKLCIMVDRERLSVFRVDHWVQKSGHPWHGGYNRVRTQVLQEKTACRRVIVLTSVPAPATTCARRAHFKVDKRNSYYSMTHLDLCVPPNNSAASCKQVASHLNLTSRASNGINAFWANWSHILPYPPQRQDVWSLSAPLLLHTLCHLQRLAVTREIRLMCLDYEQACGGEWRVVPTICTFWVK
jgi:hypothetical protein